MPEGLPSRPVAVITGASRGIGEQIARQLANRGYALVLAARSQGPLHDLAAELERGGTPVLAVVADVRVLADLRTLADAVMNTYGRVDVLVHNAGVAHPGITFDCLTDEQVHSSFATNLLAPIELTRLLLPAMLKAKRGTIVIISSIGGHIGLPSASMYSTTKFALRGFAAALRRELQPHGIHVCLVCPGFIRTKLTEAVWDLLDGIPLAKGTPERVAKAVAKVIEKPRREIIVPAYNRFSVWFDRNFPGVADMIASYFVRNLLPRVQRRQERGHS